MPTQIPTNTPPPGTTTPQVMQVIQALEDPQYQWRTLGGIATSTNLPEEIVKKIVTYLQSEGAVIRSSLNADDGSELFTTREHYREKASLWSRFMAALRNRAD